MQLISTVQGLDDERRELFDIDESNDVWKSSHNAKNAIEQYAYVLKETINDHIYALSKEDEIMPVEFHHDYVGIEEIIKECGPNIWNNYYRPISDTIFHEIQKLANNKIPIHLLAKYPFEVSLVLDDLEAFWSGERPENVSTDNIIQALNELKFLKSIDNEERASLIYIIHQKKDFYQNTKEDRNSHRSQTAAIIHNKQQKDLEKQEKKNKEHAERVELFQKDQITATNVQKELFSIFSKIQKRRGNRITDALIAYFRRHLNVTLLQNDESLKFIFEQL